jgi:hypothetical protein
LIALLPHDLVPKGFHSGINKSGLEGITMNINNYRRMRRGPGWYSRKDKESNFSFWKVTVL